MKRVFSLALGLGAGLLIGAYAVKRLDEAQRAIAPANLAGVALLQGRMVGAIAHLRGYDVDDPRVGPLGIAPDAVEKLHP